MALLGAVEWYAACKLDPGYTHNICVEPDDYRAAMLPGWHPPEEPGDPDDRPFRMFKVKPIVEWKAREVKSFTRAEE